MIQRDGETPRCVSAGEIRKFNTPPPQVVRNRGWCVVVPGRPPSASVATDEQSLVTVDEAPQPRSRRPSRLPLRRQPRKGHKAACPLYLTILSPVVQAFPAHRFLYFIFSIMNWCSLTLGNCFLFFGAMQELWWI